MGYTTAKRIGWANQANFHQRKKLTELQDKHDMNIESI